MKKVFAGLVGFGFAAATAAAEVTVRETDGVVRVEIDGALFSDYHYQEVARPYLYPVIGPTGVPMTRDWPMVKVEGDATDHIHHKGIWYAHGNVNGLDFWSEQKAFGKTVHQKFLELRSGKEEGVIRSLNNWVASAARSFAPTSACCASALTAPCGALISRSR